MMKENEHGPGIFARAAVAASMALLLAGVSPAWAQEAVGEPSAVDESDDEATDDRAPSHGDRNDSARTEPHEELPDSVPGGDSSVTTEEDDAISEVEDAAAAAPGPSVVTEEDDAEEIPVEGD